MKAGLRESMRGEWSGDCDLGDGQLQQMKQVYDDRLSRVRGTCIYNLVQMINMLCYDNDDNIFNQIRNIIWSNLLLINQYRSSIVVCHW